MTSIAPLDLCRAVVGALIDHAIFTVDINGCITSWSDGATRFYGVGEQEMLTRHVSQLYTLEQKKAGAPHQELQLAAAQGRYATEDWRTRADGAQCRAQITIAPIRTHEGDLIGFVQIIRDVTAHLQAREDLTRSGDLFRRLVEGVTDYAIYMIDLDGHIESWNAGAERMKGYSAEEIIGEHFEKFHTAEDRAAGLPAQSLTVAKLTGRYEKEGVRIRKDGTSFLAHVVIDAIRDEKESLVGYAKITRDITTRRQAKEAFSKATQAIFGPEGSANESGGPSDPVS